MEFLIYSVEYWPEHARNSEQYGEHLLDKYSSLFGKNLKVRSAWWYVYADQCLGERESIATCGRRCT